MKKVWQRVVESAYRGDGWWHIVFDCGHAMRVLHGATSPLGEEAQCCYCLPIRRTDLEAL